jgi:hypothetical protein
MRVLSRQLQCSFASSFQANAQTSPTSSTRDDITGTVTTPAHGAKERRFAPGTIAKTIIEEASRLASDAVRWRQKLRELELDVKNNAPDVETTARRVDECLVMLRAVAARLAPNSETRINLRKQEDAIRDLASRAEARAEQSIHKIAGYFQQKTTELRAISRSKEETRIQLIAQIDQLQELKEQLNFNHAAAQNGERLKGAQTSLKHLQALTADAGRRRSSASRNVLGEPLDIYSIRLTTGFLSRWLLCNTGQEDVGSQDKAAYGLRVRGGALGCIGGRAPQIGRFASRSLRTADPRHGVARSELIKVS